MKSRHVCRVRLWSGYRLTHLRKSVAWSVLLSALISLWMTLSACETLIEDRIPSMPVNINLSGHGIWNTYGVAAWGQNRRFILSSNLREPAGFAYPSTAATGFGGVLLIYGMDPFTTELAPIAYDLSCPVERSRTVRVEVDPLNDWEAFCPVCGSRYNVVERGGAPISGQALLDRYGLRMYQCIPPADGSGGYLITNRY